MLSPRHDQPRQKTAFENQFEHFRLRRRLLSYARAHACHCKNAIQVLAEAWLDVPAYGRQRNFIEVRYLDRILSRQRMSRWQRQNQRLAIQSLAGQRLFPNWQNDESRVERSAHQPICLLRRVRANYAHVSRGM